MEYLISLIYRAVKNLMTHRDRVISSALEMRQIVNNACMWEICNQGLSVSDWSNMRLI